MGREILCTVGTSILTNRDNRPWAGWNPRRPDPLPSLEKVNQWLKDADPEKASAEINTLNRLELSEIDSIIFLYSDTKEGLFCAERLRDLFKTKVGKVELQKIGSLGYGADEFSSGLKSLVDIVIKRVHQAKEQFREPIFCATGGFKAEIAFLNLIGALLGIEVYYIHELHREIVRLPRLPLSWDAEFVARHKDFFQWIDEEPRKSVEVESWLRSRPELRDLIEDTGDGYTYLSAAGNLLYKVAQEHLAMGPRVKWPKADPRPPREKNKLSGIEHHRPPSWEKFVERLCYIDCVSLVRYDQTAYGGPRVRILDAQNGIFFVRYEQSGRSLPLRVETTARGQAQCELVANYLRRLR